MYTPNTVTRLGKIFDSLSLDFDEDREFILRISTSYDTIENLAYRLYGQSSHTDQFIEEVVSDLFSYFKKRDSFLKEIDRIREKSPDWFLDQNLVGMMLYVDKFSGNLKDFPSRINYLEELGVNLIHMMPLMKCPPNENDGGYAVSDFRQVNPELGSIEDLVDISQILKRKEMYLMLDFAVNHTSDQHEWAKAAKAGDKKYMDYFYIYENRDIPDQFEQSLPEVFPENSPGNFTYIDEIKRWVMTVFHNYQWDLNYTNPQVFREMLKNLLFLANVGVDIIRLDALAFTWKKIGTTSQNLEEAHLLMRLFKACSQIAAPGMAFLAEAIVAPSEIVKYFGDTSENNNECDLAYNATLMTLLWDAIATKNKRLLEVSLQNIPKKLKGRSWLNYIRCHDDIGLGYEDLHAQWAGYDPTAHRKYLTDFLIGSHGNSFSVGAEFMKDPDDGTSRISGTLASLAGLEKAIDANSEDGIEMSIRRILMMHSIILSYGGIPMLYMSDELGEINDYSYKDKKETKNDNRWMHRPAMNWQRAERRGITGAIENRIFKTLKRYIEIRKSISEFSDSNNTFRIDTYNQYLMGFVRINNGNKTAVFANFNDQQEPLYKAVLEEQFSHTKLIDQLENREIDFMTGNYMMSPYETLWIKKIEE